MAHRLGEQLGNYRLTHLLGQGGFAEVYLAEHVHLRTPVAIKVLYDKLTAQDVAAFTTEAQTVARLSHPHILRVLDFGFVQTLPFLVMDYAPGGTLRDRHPSGSLVALPQVVAYVTQIAQALAYAHTNKLIHRDVKPENMLLSADGSVLLSDFGIVATAHSTASMKTIDATGTVAYMAPEHIKGQPRPASDQYALAICVYEWLCGERPFLGDTPIEMAMRQIADAPPSLCQRVPALPSSVEQIIFKALAKDPSHRFPDMLAFSSALEHWGPAQQDPPSQTRILPSQQGAIASKLARLAKSAVKTRIPPSQQGTVASSPQPALPPTVPANPMMSLQPPQKPVEEEVLEIYLQSLAHTTSGLDAYDLASKIEDFIEDHQAFFDQPAQGNMLLTFCDRAIQATRQGGSARNIFVEQKAKCLASFKRYEEALDCYLQSLAHTTSGLDAYDLASKIEDFIEDHQAFFDQPAQGNMLLTFCDRAIQATRQGGSARNIFVEQKAKCLMRLKKKTY